MDRVSRFASAAFDGSTVLDITGHVRVVERV